MFLGIGLVMAILQGSWVRTIPPNKTKSVAELVYILYQKVYTIYLIKINLILIKLYNYINILGFVVDHSSFYLSRFCK